MKKGDSSHPQVVQGEVWNNFVPRHSYNFGLDLHARLQILEKLNGFHFVAELPPVNLSNCQPEQSSAVL